jgi:hypothetical protein
MGRSMGLVAVLIALGAGAWIYMHEAQSATVEGAGNPTGTVNEVAVRRDLMSIARAERMHNSLHGGYVSLDELRSAGELTMGSNNRGPYNYSIETTDSGFQAVATYAASDNQSASRITIDQDMHFSVERPN